MTVGFFNGQLDLTDVLIVAGLVGVGVKTFLEERGITHTSKLLRAENNDLLRRNAELESSIERLDRRLREQDILISEQAANIVVLNEKMQELAKRDQEAVLRALERHEVAAERRYEKTKNGDETRHGEFIEILRDVAANIQTMAKEATG